MSELPSLESITIPDDRFVGIDRMPVREFRKTGQFPERVNHGAVHGLKPLEKVVIYLALQTVRPEPE